MASGIIESLETEGGSLRYLSPRLRAIAQTSKTHLAVDFRDFAGQKSFCNQYGSLLQGRLEGTAKLGKDGLSVDGSNGCRAVLTAPMFGAGTADAIGGGADWFIAVGFTQGPGTDGGAIVKVGDSSGGNGYGIGTGGTSFDNSGTAFIGLAEGVAWNVSSGSVSAGYHTAVFWHRQGVPHGQATTLWLDSETSVYSASGNVDQTSSPVISIGGYDAAGTQRFWAGTIHWIVVGNTGRAESADIVVVQNALRAFPKARGAVYEPLNDPSFYTVSSGGAAALEGSVAASATVAGALTTAIRPAASVSAAATVAAALTTAIRPAASVAASATVAAALSTSIRPAASVAASATVTAALTTAIRFASSVSASANVAGDISGAAALASTVSASAIVTGALSTSIRLNSSVSAAATVAGVLTDVSAARFTASLTATATATAALTGGSSSIWTPASASAGTWSAVSASSGTWAPQ